MDLVILHGSRLPPLQGEGRAKLSTMTKVTRSGGRTRAGAGREGRGSNIPGSLFGKDFICPLFERYEEQ